MGLLEPEGSPAWPAGEHRSSARPTGTVKAEVRLGWEVRAEQPSWSKLGGQMVGWQPAGPRQPCRQVGGSEDTPGSAHLSLVPQALPIQMHSWGSEEGRGVKEPEPGGQEVLLRCPPFLHKEANIIPSYLDYQLD